MDECYLHTFRAPPLHPLGVLFHHSCRDHVMFRQLQPCARHVCVTCLSCNLGAAQLQVCHVRHVADAHACRNTSAGFACRWRVVSAMVTCVSNVPVMPRLGQCRVVAATL